MSFYDNVKTIGDRQKEKLENMGSGEKTKWSQRKNRVKRGDRQKPVKKALKNKDEKCNETKFM